jgi:hypothetical protein
MILRVALVLALVMIATAPVHAEEAVAPEIRVVGENETERIHVVDHGGRWSLHAESVVAASLFRLWHQAGGPEVTSKVLLDYPYTLSVHSVTPERILEGVLEGWSYTLHYDANGRLERVRVYSAEPQRMFKTPRLVESLAAWRQLETPVQPAAAIPPEAGAIHSEIAPDAAPEIAPDVAPDLAPDETDTAPETEQAAPADDEPLSPQE